MRRLERVATPWRLVLLVAASIVLPLFVLGELVSSDARSRLVAQERATTDAAAARASDLLAARLAALQDEIVGASRNHEFSAAITDDDTPSLAKLLDTYKSAVSSDIDRLVLLVPSTCASPGCVPTPGYLLARVPSAESVPPVDDYLPPPTVGIFHVQAFRVISHQNAPPGLVISVRPPPSRTTVLAAEVSLSRIRDWLAPQLSVASELDVVDDQGRLVAVVGGTSEGQLLATAPDVATARNDFSSTAQVPGARWTVTAVRSAASVSAFDDAAGVQRLVRVALLLFLLTAAYVVGRFASELRLERESLRAANVRLDAASEAKSRFLSAVSHDLRTPLNAILGFSDVLLQRFFGDLTPKQEEYVRDIHSAGEHQLTLVNDLLDLSKIEAGRMELHPVPFSARELVESAVAMVVPLAEAKHLRLEVSVADGVGTVEQDPARVKQVVLNLLANAIKFTSSGSVRVAVSAADGSVSFAVSDTGVGIAAEDQGAVFDEFRQVGASARSAQGTGLGLALVRGFARMMGGDVALRSELGHGSTFTVTIPRRQPPTA